MATGRFLHSGSACMMIGFRSDYSDPAWILQSAEDQQRFWLCLASLASQDVAAAFGLRV